MREIRRQELGFERGRMKERREFRKRGMSGRLEEFWRKVYGDGMIESKILCRFNGRTSEVTGVFWFGSFYVFYGFMSANC